VDVHYIAKKPQSPAAARAGDIPVGIMLTFALSAPELARVAQAEGLAATLSEAFCSGQRPPNAIRISLGSIRDSQRLAAALRKLSLLLARRPAGGAGIVI
jgi:DNA-binding transcriptional MocR family regulator